jgi:hypothetical protein
VFLAKMIEALIEALANFFSAIATALLGKKRKKK